MARAPIAPSQGPAVLRLRAVFGLLCFALSVHSAAGESKRDYYEVLGIDKKADVKAIKSAYRKLALKWHPDKNPDDRENAEKMFREVAEAYEVLSNDETRKKYDTYGHDAPQGGGGGGFGDFGFGGGFGFRDANDVFKDMFGSEDPFADFSKFFDGFEEEFASGQDSGEEKQAFDEVVSALSVFYSAVGQRDKAIPDKVRGVLEMPKWAGKEQKMFHELKKKYTNPYHFPALQKLEASFSKLDRARSAANAKREREGGFGGFPGMGGGFKMGGGFGGLEEMFGGFPGFGGGGGGFPGMEGFGGGGATMSFSSFSSTSAGGKTVRSETKIVGGKRVTKTIESDGENTKATMEEESGGRIKRKSGMKKANIEQLGDHQDL